jgi:acyl-CoA thioesterase-1
MYKCLSFIFCLLFGFGVHATQLAAAAAPEAAPRTILVYGDSLSAGYGLAIAESWPALLNERLKAKQLPYKVVNASISGETTAGGRARFSAALQQAQPAVVIIALGANDGLQGLPLAAMEDNLTAMIRAAKQHNAQVLLVGIRVPPNYGFSYTQRFGASFNVLAKNEKISLLPFLLEPIALDPQAFQADGLHPTAKVQPLLLDHVWKALSPLLKTAPTHRLTAKTS